MTTRTAINRKPPEPPPALSKVSFRMRTEKHQYLKVVASMYGMSIQEWLDGLVSSEIDRIAPQLDSQLDSLRTSMSR